MEVVPTNLDLKKIATDVNKLCYQTHLRFLFEALFEFLDNAEDIISPNRGCLTLFQFRREIVQLHSSEVGYSKMNFQGKVKNKD